MAQQINLYTPVVAHVRPRFSALAMAASLGLLAAGLVALAVWSTLATRRLQHETAAAEQTGARQKQALAAELARRPLPPRDAAAIEQELAAARQVLATRRAQLAELGAGRLPPEADNATLLRLLAQTLPPTMWLTEVRRRPGQVELAGVTLQPEALRPWLARLSPHPVMAGQVLRAVKVERSDDGEEAWTFRVVSAMPAGGQR